MRTITLTRPTKAGGDAERGTLARASIVTSPTFVLGCPNLPARKNGTVTPFVGTCRERVDENAPVVPLRNTTAPPPLAETLERPTLTGVATIPDGLVTRIRQGDGAQPTNRASAPVLLLICNSTFIVHASLGSGLKRLLSRIQN